MKEIGICLALSLLLGCGGGGASGSGAAYGGNTPTCESRYGDYLRNDRALAVKRELEDQGYRAWIKHHGSYLDGTRTYVVFVETPCP